MKVGNRMDLMRMEKEWLVSRITELEQEKKELEELVEEYHRKMNVLVNNNQVLVSSINKLKNQ